MGGKATGGRRASLEEATRIGREFLEKCFQAGAFVRAELSGSILRQKPEVGDVDIVAIAGPNAADFLIAQFGLQKNKKPARCGLVEGVQIDIVLTTAEAWGAAMMFYAGPAELNIRQRAFAKRQGCLLNEKGLWKDEVRVAGETQEGIYAALGMSWIEPASR